MSSTYDATDPTTYPRTVSIDGVSPAEYRALGTEREQIGAAALANGWTFAATGISCWRRAGESLSVYYGNRQQVTAAYHRTLNANGVMTGGEEIKRNKRGRVLELLTAAPRVVIPLPVTVPAGTVAYAEARLSAAGAQGSTQLLLLQVLTDLGLDVTEQGQGRTLRDAYVAAHPRR